MSTTRKRLGMRLRKLRTAQNLSQEMMATKALITREYVSKLEAGRYDPTIAVVQRLAKALKVMVAELVE